MASIKEDRMIFEADDAEKEGSLIHPIHRVEVAARPESLEAVNSIVKRNTEGG
jgi:hypothetical protein